MHSKLIQCVVGIAKPFFPSHFTPSHGQGMDASDHENILYMELCSIFLPNSM